MRERDSRCVTVVLKEENINGWINRVELNCGEKDER